VLIEACHSRAGGAYAGEDDGVDPTEVGRTLCDPWFSAYDFECPLDRDEVARSVVDDGESRHRVPFVDGTPTRRGSRATALRRAMPRALNAASAMW
jgi:hypothetical protein